MKDEGKIVITVLVADDQTLFRSMLEKQLEMDDDFKIIASVDNGEKAVEMALKLKPDIALLDCQMPIKDGITALSEIKSKNSDIKVVILTAFESTDSIINASSAEADGYLIKDMTSEILAMAIKCIYHDIVLIHKSAYAMLRTHNMNYYAHDKLIQFGGFTFDKIDLLIMKHISEGKTNKEIARLLDYSEGTIKNRISAIISMTGLGDRTQISIFALKNNIV